MFKIRLQIRKIMKKLKKIMAKKLVKEVINMKVKPVMTTEMKVRNSKICLMHDCFFEGDSIAV